MQNIYLHGRRRNGRLQLCSDLSSSDITSSSESEYEEIDVNYIYVLGSTKCKTFIEDFIEQYLTHIGTAVPLYMSYKLIICICIVNLIFYMLLWMKNLLLYQFKIDFLVVIVNKLLIILIGTFQ
ncbi:hypothetical protein PFNF135_06269 [Plasmodium falciparum NF135/5.C10]|uniref:Plasmodium falciparum erythrocyte membrane protein 1 acidic terminal segment domain-containing protein n=1 Tax=Plasmodium falciparum NF135/5.C10 TaxID=1036726 RepID=W4I6J8_PLAFA|nr:hypothetical protein PFNF135_06269 [Plasmodium falciparum NF135/5.C10]